jgi:hypothetical protein
MRDVTRPPPSGKFASHPLIHTSPARKINTKCGGYFKIAKVWIKV